MFVFSKKTDDTENEIVNNTENSKGNNAAAIITLIFGIVCFVYGAYKLDWLTFLGINTAGINGCYYQDDEDNGGLCFDGKEAYFTFDKEKYNRTVLKSLDENSIAFSHIIYEKIK